MYDSIFPYNVKDVVFLEKFDIYFNYKDYNIFLSQFEESNRHDPTKRT